MRDRNRCFRNALVFSLFLLLAGIGSILQAQDQDQERMIIQATARGTSTQTRQGSQVNILIDQFSTRTIA